MKIKHDISDTMNKIQFTEEELLQLDIVAVLSLTYQGSLEREHELDKIRKRVGNEKFEAAFKVADKMYSPA